MILLVRTKYADKDNMKKMRAYPISHELWVALDVLLALLLLVSFKKLSYLVFVKGVSKNRKNWVLRSFRCFQLFDWYPLKIGDGAFLPEILLL